MWRRRKERCMTSGERSAGKEDRKKEGEKRKRESKADVLSFP